MGLLAVVKSDREPGRTRCLDAAPTKGAAIAGSQLEAVDCIVVEPGVPPQELQQRVLLSDLLKGA